MLTELPRILVVEDDEAIRSLLVSALSRHPFHVDAACDGLDALELTRHSEYAVILLDLMLPRMNGTEFLRAFRDAAPSARTVIIVITAFDDAALRRLDTQHAHALVRKPFDLNMLVETVCEVALTLAAHTTVAPGDAAVRPPAQKPAQ